MKTKATILLVDDEALVRDELGGLLEDEGYEVVRGSDGQQGLELFQQRNPDMVITDVRMPRSDGLSLAAAIRQVSPTTPVTVITGHGNESMAIQAIRAGVTDFLKKPVRLEDLCAALDRMQTARELGQRQPTGLPPAVRLLEHSWIYTLDNELTVVPAFVDATLSTCALGLEPTSLMELSLALRELVLNAIEHGNLGLSYEQKTRALETSTLDEVLAQRRTQAPYAGRRTRVSATVKSDEIVVQVADEGDGFDWRSLPDPTDWEHLLDIHGRGVLLARLSVDRLEYNEKGNEVTIWKRLPRREDN
jgi:CheY-like chemotaxis protein/anti-sigma regulatory factor (Ser/Thr protein kinase)